MRKTYFIIIFCLTFEFIFLVGGLDAQIWLTNEDIFSEAEEYLLSNEYNEALPLYQLLERKGIINPNISYKTGLCYLNIEGMKHKAMPYLLTATKNISKQYTEGKLEEQNAPLKTLLLLGVAHRLNKDYDEAIKCFKNLKDSVSVSDLEYHATLDLHIKRCERAKLMEESPLSLKIQKLNPTINNRYSTSNPLISSDENIIIYMNKYKFYDAILQSKKIDNEWSNPDNLNPKIKSDGDYYAVGISSDGTKLLLYAYDSYTKGDIYITEFINNKWTTIKPLNSHINTRYNETHASFSEDGRILFFTSNRPGGYGGLDIYRSEITKDKDWGAPVNLGPVINSPFNEETPFINNDLLLFSSQGHYNFGGYDIFYSNLDSNFNWQSPVNIGSPISTSDDDLFYFPLNNGTTGYYTKYDEFGKKEIYRCEIIEKSNPSRYIIKGEITTPDNQYPLIVNITIIDKIEGDTVRDITSDDRGKYECRLPAGKYKLNFITENNFKGTEEISIPFSFPLEELVINSLLSEKVMIKKITKDTIFVKDIFFAFDSDKINNESKSYLNDLSVILNADPLITIQINGYTDIIGNEEYNRKLSVRRAGSVADYLIKNTLDNKRITIKGFGEENQQAINTNTDGSDNPEGRRYNRRVEIIFTNIGDSLIIQTIKEIPEHLKIVK